MREYIVKCPHVPFSLRRYCSPLTINSRTHPSNVIGSFSTADGAKTDRSGNPPRRVNTQIDRDTHTHARTYAHKHARTHKHTHTQTHTHTCRHTQVQERGDIQINKSRLCSTFCFNAI